jgi:hypothetical protein
MKEDMRYVSKGSYMSLELVKYEIILRIEGKQEIRWDRGRLRRLQGAVGWREQCRYG